MDKAQHELVERAIEQLRAKEMPELESARRLEAVLVEADKTRKLDGDRLRSATLDLVEEADVPRYFAKATNDGREQEANGIGLLFLLLLLYLILASLPDDNDLKYVVQELIDRLLGRA